MFFLKEQETLKKRGKKKKKVAAGTETPTIQDTAAMINIYPSTSLPMEEMSEPYMAIFSQTLTVKFQTNTQFYL